MRGLLLIIVGGVLLLAAAVWYLLPAPATGPPAQASEPSPIVVAKADRKPKTTPEAARARRREAGTPEALVQPSSSPAVHLEFSPDMTIRITTPPSPTPRDLKPGMARNEVVQTYGPPALSTTQSNHGVLMERYFYLDRTRGRTTMAVMENGRVVTAAEWMR